MIRYFIRWLYPGDGAPLEDVTVVIENGHFQSITSGSDPEAIVLPGCALIPGLVNAHTHLEFSHLSTPLEPLKRFPKWIESVIAERQARRARPSFAQGLRESGRGGVVGLGEIATSDSLLANAGSSADAIPRCRIFRELLGLRPDAVDEQIAIAQQFLSQAQAQGINCGLSPHAPYSVHPDLLQRVVELARQEQLPLAIHLAETPSELELLAHGTGSLVEMLSGRGVWQPGLFPAGTRPRDILQMLDSVDHLVIVHGNELKEDELDVIAEHNQWAVVYCPRTHAAMQQTRHPWQAMQARGIRVALGTDSRASNPDLNLFNELKFLAEQHPRVAAEDLLALATVHSANALGWPDLGTIRVGQPAHACLVQVSDEDSKSSQPAPNLFQGRLVSVMNDGRWNEEPTQ